MRRGADPSRAGETVGWLAYRLLLFPPSVAALLREAGSEVLEQVGQILARDGEPPAAG